MNVSNLLKCALSVMLVFVIGMDVAYSVDLESPSEERLSADDPVLSETKPSKEESDVLGNSDDMGLANEVETGPEVSTDQNSESDLQLGGNSETKDDVIETLALSVDVAHQDGSELRGSRVVQDGLYVLSSMLEKSLVFEVGSSNPNNGAGSCLWYQNNQSNQVIDVRWQSDGTYLLRMFHSDKVLAVSGVKAPNGASVVQWEDNATFNMRWIIEASSGGGYRIRSADTNRCLDFASNEARAAAPFVVWEPTGSVKQTFSFQPAKRKAPAGKTLEEGIYEIALSGNGNLHVGLDAADGRGESGTTLKTHVSKDVLTQKFYLSYHVSDGCYTVESLASGKVLAVRGMQAANGASVVQWDDNGTANMRWSIEKHSGGVRLVSKDTERVLDFASNSPVSGIDFVAWDKTGSGKQVYALDKASVLRDGYYAIVPRQASGLRVDINGGSVTAGAPGILWQENGGFSQKFHLSRNSDDTFTIKTLHSGQDIGISSVGRVVQLAKGSSVSQKWTLYPDRKGGFQIRAKTNDGTIKAFSTAKNNNSSAPIFAENFNSNSLDQSFSFDTVSLLENGLHVISPSSNPDLIVSQKNASTANGVGLHLAEDTGLPWTKYDIQNEGDNVIVITSYSSKKVLAIDAQAGDGALVMQWDNNKTNNMKWKVVPDYYGSVFLSSVQNGRNIDFNSNAVTVGDSVVVWSAHFGVKQKWKFFSTQPGKQAYVSYDLDISTMLAYQMTNPYITSPWQEVLAFLDPSRIIEKSGGYYSFANIRGYSGLTAKQINDFIASTSSGRFGKLIGTGEHFVAAAKKYNLNEMYLLAHAILESAWGTSTLAKGYLYDGVTPVGGKIYPAGTYYNFYGIGAIDSGPLSGGRSMAIQNGWKSVPLAIEGAAKWLAENYVYRSDYPQMTLYDMRWDPARSDDTNKRSWHQYATDIKWASSIGLIMEDGYRFSGVTPTLSFIIPRYS